MGADMYEKERAAWLRAGRGQGIASRMRRVDLLDRAASRRDRDQAGLAGAAAVQAISKSSSWTWTHAPGGEWRGWVKWAALPMAAFVLPSVPGVGASSAKPRTAASHATVAVNAPMKSR